MSWLGTRPQRQAHRHDPDNGVNGDCHRTCYACILDLDQDEVPHFYEHGLSDDESLQRLHDFHRDRGLMVLHVAYPGETDLGDVARTQQALNPGVPYILGGTSPRGTGHSVVYLDGELHCDPSLDGGGLVGPMEDGLWWVTYVVGAPPTPE